MSAILDENGNFLSTPVCNGTLMNAAHPHGHHPGTDAEMVYHQEMSGYLCPLGCPRLRFTDESRRRAMGGDPLAVLLAELGI